MKIPTLLAAGAVAIAGVAAVPAAAHQYGDRYDSGYRGDDGYRHDRDDRDDRGGDRRWDARRDHRYDEWRREHGWRGHDWGRRGWHHGYYGRPRVECRVVRGYYGPERRCFRAY